MKTSTKIQSKSTAAILAAGLLALAGIAGGGMAQADEPSQSLTKIVAYGDLNLESPQGAQVLYSRLRNAARSVCTPLEGRDLVQLHSWQTCFNHAVDSAVVEVNKALVSALHNQNVNRAKS
jgi:UrcA family protein